MYLDKQTELSSQQAPTASEGSTNYYDQGAAGDLGHSGKTLLITVDTAVTASGGATVQFQLQCDSDSAFGSPKTVIETPAIPKASLVPGYALLLPIPFGLDEQYIRAYYVIATGPLLTGKFSARIVESVQASKAYPDAV